MKTTLSPRKRPVVKTETPNAYRTGEEAGEAKARHIEKLLEGADWSTFKQSGGSK